MFGVGRYFTCLCVRFYRANFHSFITGIKMTSRMTHFYLLGKGKDDATVGSRFVLLLLWKQASQPFPVNNCVPSSQSWSFINQPPDLLGACSN